MHKVHDTAISTTIMSIWCTTYKARLSEDSDDDDNDNERVRLLERNEVLVHQRHASVAPRPDELEQAVPRRVDDPMLVRGQEVLPPARDRHVRRDYHEAQSDCTQVELRETDEFV